MRFDKISDLPQHLQAQAHEKLSKFKSPVPKRKNPPPPPPDVREPPITASTPKPNKYRNEKINGVEGENKPIAFISVDGVEIDTVNMEKWHDLEPINICDELKSRLDENFERATNADLSNIVLSPELHEYVTSLMPKTYILAIFGKLPTLNEYINAERTSKYLAAKMKKEAQDHIGWHVLHQLKGVRIEKPVHMFFDWFSTNRKTDPDNISSYGRKLILDAVVGCGVLKSDGWKQIKSFTDCFAVDKENPRVIVRICEV